MFLTTAIKVKGRDCNWFGYLQFTGSDSTKIMENGICISENFETKNDGETDVSDYAHEWKSRLYLIPYIVWNADTPKSLVFLINLKDLFIRL